MKDAVVVKVQISERGDAMLVYNRSRSVLYESHDQKEVDRVAGTLEMKPLTKKYCLARIENDTLELIQEVKPRSW